jgi:BirA family biotin operon repressor/biotin-[acetyl-CoA-carboxylase] ligase
LDLAPGHRLIQFDTIDSTNAEAQRLAAEGEQGPLWISANRQSAGRGRLGRQWVSEAGNLYCTFLFTPEAPPAVLSQLSIVTAVAVRLAAEDARELAVEARKDVFGGRISIKWPNDMLLEGRKFCGILVESLGQGCVAIGVGVNLAFAPENTPYPVARLGEVEPDKFLTRLSFSMAHSLETWARGTGFAAIRKDWLAHAYGLGRSVEIGGKTGSYEGLAEDGALVLKLATGQTENIHAGDVRLTGNSLRIQEKA